MGVLDGVVIVEWKGAVLGVNLERSLVTNRDFATRLFPNYSGQYLFLLKSNINISVFAPIRHSGDTAGINKE